MSSIDTFTGKFGTLDLPLHGVRLPSFEIPEAAKVKVKLPENASNYEFLRLLCLDGFKKLKLEKDSESYKKYAARVKYELEIINELEFVDYILLVWNVINFCHESDIAVGLGRGSAAGSLVLFLIGVTRIDPIKHDLFFERFISRIRAKKKVVDGVTYLDGSLMCDVDMDICFYNRSKVLAFLEEKFHGRTSKILTLNTLSGKLLIKECGKVIGEKQESEMTEVADMIPKIHGIPMDIDKAHDGEKDENGEWKTEPIKPFVEWCDKNPEIYETALKLQDLIKNKGMHASGVLLSYAPLNETIPIEMNSDKESVSSFDMNWASKYNVKLDVLGLRGVSVVQDVCRTVGIQIEDIDFEDPFIYRQLQDLRTPHGLFQIEAETNYRFLQHVRPRNLEQLSGVLALARPGALQFIDKYAKFTNEGTYEAIHPFFDDILKASGGVALYQEQLMKMAHKVGFTLDEAEILRRIVGKKKKEEVAKWEAKIEEKIRENNLDPKIKDILWKILEDSASYSFNKSHSVAYAALAAITVYLKFKYPKEFFVSLLKMTRHEAQPIQEIEKIQKELHHFGIKLLPPHILKSELDFAIQGNDIRFGLLSIKGISDKSIEKINSFRNKFANKFEIFHAAEQAGLQIGILSALIQAGALDGFKQTRSKVVLEAQLWNLLTTKEKQYAIELGPEFDYDLVAILIRLTTLCNEKGKPIIKFPPPEALDPATGEVTDGKKYRYMTIKKKYLPYEEIYLINHKEEDFANWWYEKTLMGYAPTKSLRQIFAKEGLDYISCAEINNEEASYRSHYIIASVSDVRNGIAKNEKKTKYFKMTLSDETGSCTVMLFNDQIDACKENNKGVLPEKGNIVIVRGKKKSDAVFADMAAIQDQKIYIKLSELRNAKKELTDKEEAANIKE